MKYVYNGSDVNMNLENDQSLLVYMNSTAYTFTYGTDFSTMNGLANAIEARMDTVAGQTGAFDVSVTGGTLKVDRVMSAGATVSIDSFSGTPLLAVGLSNLANTYDDLGDTKSSSEMYFESQIYAGRDFTTLTDLAVAIEGELDGNVISSNEFSVSYDNTTGQFAFTIDHNTNSAIGTLSLSGLSLDKAYSGSVFENNIVPAGSSSLSASYGMTAQSTLSGTFLRTAQDNDPMTELFTSSGDSLGLDATAIVQFSSSVGGVLTPGSASIPAGTSTLDDMRTAIAEYLGYDSSN
ncbi:MAG: hypothetical protein C0603_13285 [Denitrovibrio sp.]|nr:MAG: hypothetical protein C0603_13285 [Denitrovibrio sp.]